MNPSVVPPSVRVRYGPDRLFGTLMVLGHVSFFTWSLALSFGRYLPALENGPTPILAWLASSILTTALYLWTSLGVVHSRQWGMVVNTSIAAVHVLTLVNLPSRCYPALAANPYPTLAFNLPIFLYCGLRSVGAFGPRVRDLLDLGEPPVEAGPSGA